MPTSKEHWDAIFEKGQQYTPIAQGLFDAILGRANQPKTALDIACGTGDLVMKLAQHGIAVIGVDVSPVALSKTKERLQSAGLEAKLIEADFNSADFTKKLEGPYDIVFIRLAFAFVREKNIFLENVKKLMVPGGAFVCILPGLVPGGVYDARQKNISISEHELELMLQHNFSSVELVSRDVSLKPDWPLLTYLCR